MTTWKNKPIISPIIQSDRLAMEISTSKSIKDKIFIIKDIYSIIDLFIEEYKKDSSEKNMKIIVRGVDFEYTFNHKEIEKFINMIKGECVDTITINFNAFEGGKFAGIKISQGSNYTLSSYSVSSNDDMWAHGFASKISHTLRLAEDQKRPSNLTYELIKYSAYYLIGLIVIRIIDIFYTPSEPSTTPQILLENVILYYAATILITTILGWLILTIPLSRIGNPINKLWPQIEFDFNPDKYSTAKNRRDFLWFIFISFIIPIFVNFIFAYFIK